MSLVVARQSWHYRLHAFIRRIWGWTPSPHERWTLCPYFWTIVAGTLFTTLVIVPALIGWAFAKISRKMYKAGLKNRVFSWWTRFCDKTSFSAVLDTSHMDFERSFIVTGLVYCVILAMMLAAVCLIGLLFVVACYVVVDGISNVPGYLMTAVLYAGWGLFYGFAGLGIAAAYTIFGISTAAVWLWSEGSSLAVWVWSGICSGASSFFNWLTSSETWIGLGKGILGFFTSLIVGVVVLSLVGFATVYIFLNEKIWSWFELKANGYAEAREKIKSEERAYRHTEEYWEKLNKEERAEDARKLARRQRIEAFWESVFEYLEITWKIVIFVPVVVGLSVWTAIRAVAIFFRNLYAKPVMKGGRESSQLGPIGVLVTMLIAFKKRACPLIEFADSKDLTAPPSIPPSNPTTPTPTT